MNWKNSRVVRRLAKKVTGWLTPLVVVLAVTDRRCMALSLALLLVLVKLAQGKKRKKRKTTS